MSTNPKSISSRFPRPWLLPGILSVVVAHAAHAQAPAAPPSPPPMPAAGPSANDRLLVRGPEDQLLMKRKGTWNVVMTMQLSPDAKPIVVKGMVAERAMIGLYMQETMHPTDTQLPDFKRLAYLTYNKVEGRWQYTSMDTRAPIGIMFAKSYGQQRPSEITLYFEGFALPGFGPEMEGRFLRARHVIAWESETRDVTRQYWTSVGGQEWLAIQYEFTRR
jgi:hypothetical protein